MALKPVSGEITGNPASELIRLTPFGVPQPVQRSKPTTAGKLVGLPGQKLLPTVMSWKQFV